jgi:hypothetical protein
MKNPFILADLAQEVTFCDPKVHDFVKTDVSPALLRYRQWLRQAHRFVIDDDMVEKIVEVSSARNTDPNMDKEEKKRRFVNTIKETGERIHLARLPYPVMWFEYDNHVRIGAILKHGTFNDPFGGYDAIPKRNGYLLVRDPVVETRYVIFIFSGNCDGKDDPRYDVIRPISFMVDTDGPLAYDANIHGARTLATCAFGERSRLDEYLKKIPNATKEFNEALVPTAMMPLGYPLSAYEMVPYRHQVYAATSLITQRYIDHLVRNYHDTGYDIQEKVKILTNVCQENLRESSGDVRFVATFLAMLNNVPVITTAMKVTGQRHVGHRKFAAYLSYSRITLKLPKRNPVQYVDRTLRNAYGETRKAHEVRGHWCHDHSSGRLTCDHVYGRMDRPNHEQCVRCGSHRWWRHEHVRGDASKGWVKHDYVVEPS